MNEKQTILGRLVQRISQLDARQLLELERIAASEMGLDFRSPLKTPRSKAPHSKDSKAVAALPHSKDWPRAPVHRLEGKGAFIVTAATLHKQHFFRSPQALDYLESMLLAKAKEYDWRIEAWAVFSNHYHFVGQALMDAKSLSPMLQAVHSDTAKWLNSREQQASRQVWHNFWETKLTYEKSYFARLHYVHRNAVHHGLVTVPNQYRWCSAAWFERTAAPAQVKTIYSFKTDKINVLDDFDPLECGSAPTAFNTYQPV